MVTASFFVSEIGDKTQLATVSLAGNSTEVIGVWLGSTAGMVLADALAIGVGVVVGKRLPHRAIGWGAAALFAVFGVIAIARGLTGSESQLTGSFLAEHAAGGSSTHDFTG